jgi:hypothetical protein
MIRRPTNERSEDYMTDGRARNTWRARLAESTNGVRRPIFRSEGRPFLATRSQELVLRAAEKLSGKTINLDDLARAVGPIEDDRRRRARAKRETSRAIRTRDEELGRERIERETRERWPARTHPIAVELEVESALAAWDAGAAARRRARSIRLDEPPDRSTISRTLRKLELFGLIVVSTKRGRHGWTKLELGARSLLAKSRARLRAYFTLSGLPDHVFGWPEREPEPEPEPPIPPEPLELWADR